MDPDAIWKMMCESLQDLQKDLDNLETRKQAIDCLEVFARWLRMGGFPPKLAQEDIWRV